jgi:hypothetical protein
MAAAAGATRGRACAASLAGVARQRLARQHLVAHGGVVHEAGHDDRRLFQIVGRRFLVDIQVGMVHARAVVERILDELESRQPDRVEVEVVGAARAADRDRAGSQVGERLEPLFEDRAHAIVALQVDAANPARSVVDVEIARELCVLRLERHVRAIGEVCRDVRARPE